jgi:type IV fimbrial biogenesis protein FimT
MHPWKRSRRAGFTLIEILVVLALMSIIALFSFPALQRMINRGKIQGITTQTSILMQQARFEAIKRGEATFVVADADGGQVLVVTDDNGDGQWNTATDTVVSRAPLPTGVKFWAAGEAPNGAGAVTFTPALACTPTCPTGGGVAYRTDGSVSSDSGAFRFGDQKDNFTEVAVAIAATGRIEVRKYDPTDNKYHVQGDNGKPWSWN